MSIVVTGFGQFRNYTINPSWEAVRGLNDVWDDSDYKLVTEQIPVDYDFVQTNVPDKWKDSEPKFVVHVGVSHLADKLTLERTGNNTGYDKPDVNDRCPPGGCCVPGTCDTMATCLDLDTLVSDVNSDCAKLGNGVEACTSDYAGQYLCDFVYYKSLHATNGRSLFIHVPEDGKPYTIQQMTTGIKIILKNIIKQL